VPRITDNNIYYNYNKLYSNMRKTRAQILRFYASICTISMHHMLIYSNFYIYIRLLENVAYLQHILQHILRSIVFHFYCPIQLLEYHFAGNQPSAGCIKLFYNQKKILYDLQNKYFYTNYRHIDNMPA
jgi:hypothetical protein